MDSQTINSRITAFLARSKETQQKNAAQKVLKGITLAQLIKEFPQLSKESVDRFFVTDQTLALPKETFGEIRQSLHKIRLQLNKLPQDKRFYILETIDFFGNAKKLQKLIPTLLDNSAEVRKKGVLDFVHQTFKTLNRNIETIISSPTLIEQQSLHIERGGLYSFSSDIARLVIMFFQKEFLDQLSEYGSDVAKVEELFKKPAPLLLQNLAEDEKALRKLTIKFITSIQTHGFLYLYARKRDSFYKQFLSSRLLKNRVKNLSPFQCSQILSGCLLRNKQLKPPEQLLNMLQSKKQFEDTHTANELSAFIEHLSPSTVLSIIDDYRHAARKVQSADRPEKEAAKDERILDKVFSTGFIKKKLKKVF